MVELRRVELLTSCVQGRRSTNWAITPFINGGSNKTWTYDPALSTRCSNQLSYRPVLNILLKNNLLWILANQIISLRRWSSRRFPTATLLRLHPSHRPHRGERPLALGYPLLVRSTPMVWRAVYKAGNVFTAAFWSAITSDSDFIESSCRL